MHVVAISPGLSPGVFRQHDYVKGLGKSIPAERTD